MTATKSDIVTSLRRFLLTGLVRAVTPCCRRKMRGFPLSVVATHNAQRTPSGVTPIGFIGSGEAFAHQVDWVEACR